MYQYAVIANLERDGTDLYTLSSLPLHVTILSIFFSEREPLELARLVIDAAAGRQSFSIKVTGRALFGPDADIPVTTVEKTEMLEALHLRLLEATAGTASFRAPQYTGDGFSPHVTDQAGRTLQEDQSVMIDNLTFVEIDGQDVRVVEVMNLASAT